MRSTPDDDALSWSGDEDPTLEVGEAPPRRERPPTERIPSAPEAPVHDAPAERDSEPMGNALLITLGVLGGIYALWAIGWIVGGLRLQGAAQYLVADVMFQGSFWLAVLAAPIWFGATLLLTRDSRAWVRIAWLVAGAVMLVPWPFVMIGTVGR